PLHSSRMTFADVPISPMKILRCFQFVMLTFILAVAPRAHSAPVSYWFSGVIDYMEIGGDGLPSSIDYGTPFSGYVFYESTGYSSANSNTMAADYYFKNTAAFKMVLQVGGHTFATSNNVPNSAGYIGVQNDSGDRDTFDFNSNGLGVLMDGRRFYLTNSSIG